MDKDLLFKPRLAEAEVVLDIGPVRVRAMTRGEVAEAYEAATDELDRLDRAELEYRMVSCAMVDPVLTVEEVRAWAAAAPAGEFVAVMERVQSLSALGEDATKSRVRPSRRERRA